MTVIREYRKNLKQGRLKASVVHDLLNTFTDDDTGMKMGDLQVLSSSELPKTNLSAYGITR